LAVKWLCCLLAFGSQARADWGVFDGGIYLSINGGPVNLTGAAAFNGSTLGNFTATNSFLLKGGQARTYKHTSGSISDVTSAAFNYRIYASGGAPGAFSPINLPFGSNDPGAPAGSQDQTWRQTNSNINILSGLTNSGVYVLEFYISAVGTNPNETKYFSNNGANYKATFELNAPSLTVNGINANYTTTKFFVDEVAGDSFPVNIVFKPNSTGTVSKVEIFSNLNRRDLATVIWTNADGIVTEEGIYPRPGNFIQPGMTSHYFAAYSMQTNIPGSEFSLTLQAQKTGAYRLTARYMIQGNTNWFWYTDTAAGRRDHAIVVSPKTSREIVMYEVNTLIVKATGTTESARSTFVDLWDGPGASAGRPPWNLDYVKDLGVNWLWFQPIHPYGEVGRHLSAADINARDPSQSANTWLWNNGSPSENVNYPYALGSPYAVRNFFEIEPRMSKANTRSAAMTEFTNFVAAADSKNISIMLDAAFNHTSWDTELGALGVQLFATNASPTQQVRNVETRFFTRVNDYYQRATNISSIAPAPDRFDFGKWLDVKDVFFGRYAALVPNSGESGKYQNEEDWFDYTLGAPGLFDQVTQNTWKYFGAYIPYWLEKTGYPSGTNPTNINLGLDGLRCDFGQGLPPQCWEYIINRARSVKWNFVFMAETLDGGAPPYRSNRHFDILNENILFAMKGATQVTDYRAIFEERRTAFGQGLVLLNTVSHDEANYADPWQAFIRYALCSTIDGSPMIFTGQELGISTNFGYDLMENNFGKYIPHFKTYNSLMPLWNYGNFGHKQLFPAYGAVGRARHMSPALRSSNRYFIDQVGGAGVKQTVFSVVKYQTANASAATSDVVIGFVNLDRNTTQSGTFNVNIDLNGSNLFGIKSNRHYNARNLAAFTGIIPGRDTNWLWGAGISGTNVLNSGVSITNGPIPGSNAAWTNNPYEAKFLKLYDVTTPPAPTGIPVHVLGTTYVVGTNAVFTWSPAIDPEGLMPHYRIAINRNGIITTNFTTNAYFAVGGSYGDVFSISVTAVNPFVPANASSSGPASGTVTMIDPNEDDDEDGLPNWAEVLAGTDLFNSNSVFVVEEVVGDSGLAEQRITVSTAPGRLYTIYYSDTPFTDNMIWSTFANLANGIGTWLETNTISTTRTFVDDGGPDTTLAPPAQSVRNYRFTVEVP